MNIPTHILDTAFKIGFNYQKEKHWEQATVSLPCCAHLKNGTIIHKAELLFINKIYFKYSSIIYICFCNRY